MTDGFVNCLLCNRSGVEWKLEQDTMARIKMCWMNFYVFWGNGGAGSWNDWDLIRMKYLISNQFQINELNSDVIESGFFNE